MARTSKYDTTKEFETTIWKAAIYVRLSREDGDKEESDSISNQKDLLLDFASHHDDIRIVDIFEDDGWSGTNFNRPAFIKMIDLIKKGEINCVIVKDLSRFGRNYIESGNYLEQIFPFLNVRFVSVTDMLDSYRNPSQMNTIAVPIKNIINDEYCRDISNKVRSSLTMKRKKGEFIGSFAAYGFIKDPLNKGRIIIDEEAAEVVRQIYDWFLEGLGIITICKKLNSLGIVNPTAYKKSKGMNYRHPNSEMNDALWCEGTVRRILTDRKYCGDMVQGQNKVTSYKVQKSRRVPEKDWIIVENTHDPIVSREVYMRVQELLGRDTRKAPKQEKVYLFSGYVKCADCGRAMNRMTNNHSYGEYRYYLCSTYKRASQEACTRHTIRSDYMEKAVLRAIQLQVAIAVDVEKVIGEVNQENHVSKASWSLEKVIAGKEQELKRLNRIKDSLYGDWKDGLLTKEEYITMKADYVQQIEERAGQVDKLRRELQQDQQQGVNAHNAFIENFTKYRNVTELNREMIVDLIENIYVHEGNKITIHFKFQNEMQKALEFIERNTPALKCV